MTCDLLSCSMVRSPRAARLTSRIGAGALAPFARARAACALGAFAALDAFDAFGTAAARRTRAVGRFLAALDEPPLFRPRVFSS